MGENRLLTPCNCRLRAVSLSSWSVEQNARDTQMTTRVARACTPLTKSEEKERMLAVYCNCQSNGSDRLRKGPLLAPLFFSHHSPLSELDAGNRGTSYAQSGKGDLPEAKPAHQGEIPLNHEGNTRNNGIKFLQLLLQSEGASSNLMKKPLIVILSVCLSTWPMCLMT